jgi:Uma2 family endonuclease
LIAYIHRICATSVREQESSLATNKPFTKTEYLPEATSEFFHYYDSHATKEDLMGESTAQSNMILYLLNVLRWLYREEGWFVVSNLNIYRLRRRHEYPLAPDVAVFKGVIVANPGMRALRSWRLYEPGRPAPQVVFELASEETWREDLEDKPAKYAALGVREYYAYDPNDPPYWPATRGRLRGWQLSEGALVEQTPDARGWLWSAELASWLAPDGALMRLYDRDGRVRLTEGEAERAAKEAERAAKEAERAAKEAAWAKLRELGIDPQSLYEHDGE